MPDSMVVLGIDTCGPSGSVALGRLAGTGGSILEILGRKRLEGRAYSAMLVTEIRALLAASHTDLKEIDAMVAVRGPGSFTGVRVGLSTVKGLAEPQGIPVAAVSRLAVLAMKAQTASAALDAQRNEVFLRMSVSAAGPRELLADAAELERETPRPSHIGICDDAAEAMLLEYWPEVERVRVEPPAAADAIQLAAGMIRAGQFVDLALLDGHYLRRSDAEIFGDSTSAGRVPR